MTDELEGGQRLGDGQPWSWAAVVPVQLYAEKDEKNAEQTCLVTDTGPVLLNPPTESQRLKIVIPFNPAYSENRDPLTSYRRKFLCF